MANLPVPVPRTFGVNEIETGGNLNSLRDALLFLLNPPQAFLYQATGQSVANAATVAVNLDGSVWDFYGGHSNSSNNSRYTAVVPGVYQVTAHSSWPTNATGARQVEVYKNGTAYNSGAQDPATQATNWSVGETTVDVFLNAGDYVEMFVQQQSGGALTLNSGTAPYQTYMQVRWIHT